MRFRKTGIYTRLKPGSCYLVNEALRSGYGEVVKRGELVQVESISSKLVNFHKYPKGPKPITLQTSLRMFRKYLDLSILDNVEIMEE